MPARNSSGIVPRFSMVRYEMHLLASSSWERPRKSVGWTGVEATRASAAAVGRGRSADQVQRCEDHAQEKPRTQLLIQHEGVLADPAHPGVFQEMPTMGPVST